MRKKIYAMAALAFSLLTFTGCLDVEPESDLTDQIMWKSEGVYDAFVVGVHKIVRDDAWNLLLLGEVRSDIYSTEVDVPLGGVASKSERFAKNTLDEQNPGISNYAGFYTNINQINLFIQKTQNTSVLSETKRDFYLGEMYGLRAFYYFHLLRSWNNVVWNDEPSLGFTVGGLERPVTEAAQIMNNIKQDIETSLGYFGTNYSFAMGKGYWSKAATLMLKAEVFLWSSRQMGGGTSDANTALAALEDIRTNISSLGLMDNYKDVFAYANKKNKEIIFAIHYSETSGENTMWGDQYRMNYCPEKGRLAAWYDKEIGGPFDTTVDNFNGVGYYPLNDKLFLEVFAENDTRGKATIKPFYTSEWEYQGIIAYKYQGITLSGAANRTLCDDYPIYRYADLLLMIAEAKSLTGGDPTAEINAVRQRAYGEAYDAATLGYPNQAIDADVNEAILQERFCEFVLEGKRWYDLRRFGDEYVFKYTTANPNYPKRLIWPVDRDTMVKNPAIHQTDGYETLMN